MPLHKSQGNEHFREGLAQVLAETVEFPPGVFVTVLEASVSPSQQHAIVKLSVFPTNRQQEVLDTLKTYRGDIKKELTAHLKLRQIPNFEWRFDEVGAYVESIDNVIAELKKKGDL